MAIIRCRGSISEEMFLHMRINESMISKNQRFINFWTAESSYDDLRNLVEKYLARKEDETGVSYSHESIFQRDFDTEVECIDNYCIRSKVIKLATETCELFCKAFLIDNGKTWGELKNLGHNLLDCYNALNDDDKNLIESIPLDYIMGYSVFYPLFLTPPVGCEDNYKEEYPEEYAVPLTDYLSSFASGKILPNIKARYPGQTMVDFNERFILALAKLLYSFYHTKTAAEKAKTIKT